MGRTARTPLKDAKQIVLEKGRLFKYKGKYLQVVVFSTWLTEVRALAYKFGGNAYRHGSGYLWVLSHRDHLVRMVEDCEDGFPSANGFETLIKEVYMQK